MKKLFVTVSFITKWYWKDWNGKTHRSRRWDFIEVWLVTKEYDHSRCTDYKQLLKVQALLRCLPG